MKYKMIVSDLDRTLLNNDKEISKKNLNVLKQCQEEGYKIAFATARPKRGVQSYINALEVDALIVHNGAGIYIGDQLFEQIGIAKRDVDYLINVAYALHPNYGISIEMNDIHYANFDVSAIWEGDQFTITDFKDLPNLFVDKMILHIEKEEEIEYFKEHLPKNLYFEMSEGLVGLVMHKKATKLNAVKKVSSVLGINLTEVIAFGDDLNDISLLQGVGMGIAVENALDEVKKVAATTTLSNEEHGVAAWLEHNLAMGEI